MIKVPVTTLRKNLLDYLDKVSAGQIVIIQRNNQDVAQLMPVTTTDWREKMTIVPKILVSSDELIQPLGDVWDAYL